MSITRIKGIIIQNLFFLNHSLEELMDAFFFPVLDLIIWGLMTNYFANLRGPVAGVVTFLMGGLILWNIVWRAQQDMSFAFLRNVWHKNFLNLFSSPLTPGEFIVATMALGLLRIFLTLSAVTLLAFFLYHFNLFSLGFYLLPFFVSLIAFAWAVGIFVMGLIVRFGMRIQAFSWSTIVLIHPLSAVFYPVAILPIFLQKIAWFLPTSHIFEGMREVLQTGTLSGYHLVWAFTLNAVYLILCSKFFMYMFERARIKGKIAKIES